MVKPKVMVKYTIIFAFHHVFESDIAKYDLGKLNAHNIILLSNMQQI